MKKMALVIFVFLSIIGCNNTRSKQLFCSISDNSGDSKDVTIVYSDDTMKTVTLSMSRYVEDMDYAMEINDATYGTIDLEGVTITQEKDDSNSMHTLIINFNLEKLDKEKTFSNFNENSTISSVLNKEGEYLSLNEYQTLLEDWGYTCK